MKKNTQKKKILEALKSRPWVTVSEMMRMGIANYTGRISDLRKDGNTIMNFETYDTKKKRTLSKYCLIKGA